MKQENNNFIIYKVENIEDGLVYIGATTNSIKQRQLDHTERANRGEKGKFYEAISTFGTDSFQWEQIDTATSINELAKKEVDYIYKFNSKEAGYNGDIGGGFKKTIYQYEVEDGGLINTFESLDAAANVVGAIKQQISRACLSVNQTFQGYIWSYEYPFNKAIDRRRKEVLQFDIEGKFLYKYKSITEASKKVGVNITSIAKVCRGERYYAGGFIWSY